MTHKFRTQVQKHLLSRHLPPSPIFPPALARLRPRPVVIRRALSDARYADKCVTRLQLPVDPLSLLTRSSCSHAHTFARHRTIVHSLGAHRL